MKQFFRNTMTMEEVKSTYRKMALQLHPDMGGSVEDMAELNRQFGIAFECAKRFAPKENKESSSSYVRTFYSQNGWEGSRYDSSLRTSDITKLIRDYVKYVYPTYKFSVTKDGYSHINIALMEYPVELTNYNLVKDYMEHSYLGVYVPSAKCNKRYWECSDSEKEEAICYKVENANKSESYYDKWLNPVIYNVMQDVKAFALSYNYDDSDAMTDYFDTNFYLTMGIGKWDKPAKFVEKTARITPTKVTKAQRLTA